MKTEILNLLKNYGLFEIVPVTIASYSIGSLFGGTILYLFVKAIIQMAKVSHNANTIKELKKGNKDLKSIKIGDMYVKFSEPRNKSKSKLKKAAKIWPINSKHIQPVSFENRQTISNKITSH